MKMSFGFINKAAKRIGFDTATPKFSYTFVVEKIYPTATRCKQCLEHKTKNAREEIGINNQ